MVIVNLMNYFMISLNLDKKKYKKDNNKKNKFLEHFKSMKNMLSNSLHIQIKQKNKEFPGKDLTTTENIIKEIIRLNLVFE